MREGGFIRRGRKAVTALVVGTMAVSLYASQAQARPINFSIRPQPLADAIREFGRQAGKSVVFDISSGKALTSPGVSGQLEEAQALRRLIGELPFEIRPVIGGYIITRRIEPVRRSAEPAKRQAMPPPALPDAKYSEIVVTAQKREERLVDVPMSISALSRAALVASGIGSTGSLEQVVPGLVTPNVGLAFTPAIRGVTTVSTSPGDETNVAIYLDDVYLGAPIVGLFEFQDLERIEVLKGPQGTLFGRNATGGAIRVTTRPPSHSSQAELSAHYGVAAKRIKLAAFATGPITDDLAASLHLNYVNDRGFIEGVAQNAGRRFGKLRNLGGRAKLRYEPSDALSIDVAGDASSRRDSSLYAWVPRDGINSNASLPGAVVWGPFQYGGSTAPIAQLNSWGVSLGFRWYDPEGLSVRSISGYRSARGFYQTDTDRLNLPISALRLRQSQGNFSQEILLTTPAGRRWSAVGGLYYYHSRSQNPFFDAYLGDAPGGTIVTRFTNDVLTNSYAIFGEVTFNASERLHLTAGARYTLEKKSGTFRYLIRPQGLAHDALRRTYGSPTYRAVVRLDLSDDANVYFSASSGFKSGVFNAYAYPLAAVKPEKIDAVEVGLKGKIVGLNYSLAGFLYNYRNIQLQGQTQIGGVFFVTLTNAARADIRGFEATLGGQINQDFSFDLGLSVLPVAQYSSFPAAQVFVPNPSTGGNLNVAPFDATGSRAIRAPDLQANARLTYTKVLLGGRIDASVSYAYNSGYYIQPGNFTRQDPYHVVNARVAWTDPSGRFTFSVTGENLTNEAYSFYTTDSVVGTVDVLARPREINFGIAAKF